MIQLLLSDSLQITDGPHGLIAHFNHQSFPLLSGKAESTLTNLFMHIRGGINPARICEHLREHQSSTVISPHCPCCKLEGRVLNGSGRRTVKSDDMFRAAKSRSTGTVQIRRIRTGISGAQLRAHEEAYAKRDWAKAQSKVTKVVKQRIEDLI